MELMMQIADGESHSPEPDRNLGDAARSGLSTGAAAGLDLRHETYDVPRSTYDGVLAILPSDEISGAGPLHLANASGLPFDRDRVAGQLNDPRLGNLQGGFGTDDLQALTTSPNATTYLDVRWGHINVIQEIDSAEDRARGTHPSADDQCGRDRRMHRSGAIGAVVGWQ